jgi:hypothetical protein
LNLYKNTVSQQLWDTLDALMSLDALKSFNLVGGTALSLQLGHRISTDIDLFSDSEYGSIDFKAIDKALERNFSYVHYIFKSKNTIGKSYFIGNSEKTSIKLDLFYTDRFIRPISEHEGIRMSSIEDIIAMKFEVISQQGRKKDFWDIHELLDKFSLDDMYNFYITRYEYGTLRHNMLKKLTDFGFADNDFDPICLKGKYWEIIKLDLEKVVSQQF